MLQWSTIDLSTFDTLKLRFFFFVYLGTNVLLSFLP